MESARYVRFEEYARFETNRVFDKSSPKRPYHLVCDLEILDQDLEQYIKSVGLEDINHTITWWEKAGVIKIRSFKPNWVSKTPLALFQILGPFIKMHMLLFGRLNYPTGYTGDEHLFMDAKDRFVCAFEDESSVIELQGSMMEFVQESMKDILGGFRQHLEAIKSAESLGYEIKEGL